MNETPDALICQARAIDPLLPEYDHFNHLGTVATNRLIELGNSGKRERSLFCREPIVASIGFANGPGIFKSTNGGTIQ